MRKKFGGLSETSKILVIIALCGAVGIVLRWGYVSGAVVEAFGGIFGNKP